MVGSFVRFFFTRCEESLNSLVRCAHSFVQRPLATREEKSSALPNHEVTSISCMHQHGFQHSMNPVIEV